MVPRFAFNVSQMRPAQKPLLNSPYGPANVRRISFKRLPKAIREAGISKIERQLESGTVTDLVAISEDNCRSADHIRFCNTPITRTLGRWVLAAAARWAGTASSARARTSSIVFAQTISKWPQGKIEIGLSRPISEIDTYASSDTGSSRPDAAAALAIPDLATLNFLRILQRHPRRPPSADLRNRR
jgi:hypothetical protein